MKSKDIFDMEKGEFKFKLAECIDRGRKDEYTEILTEKLWEIQENILKEAATLSNSSDAVILAARGTRSLSKTETEYYNKIISASKTNNYQAELTNVDAILPETVIDRVFEDLRTSKPLLDMINFQNTSALVQILTSAFTGKAIWGDLCAPITKEIEGEFKASNITLKKLTAFIPVCKAMLDLGPTWLDRWVREALLEALAAGLEDAIVDGDGSEKPLGMTRALTGDSSGVYPRKTPVVLETLTPDGLAPVLKQLSTIPNLGQETDSDKMRALGSLVLIVNPRDYFTKVFSATTVRATDGSYNNNVLPYPMTVIQSTGCPENRAIIGDPRRYFMGLGVGDKGGRIEYSDDYKFLEDQRTYKIKLYGNGRPYDKNSFVLCDITDLKPTVMQVEVVNPT